MNQQDFERQMNELKDVKINTEELKEKLNSVLKRMINYHDDGKNERGMINLIIATEELSELHQAVSKFMRGQENHTNIVEECADVMVGMAYIQKICKVTTDEIHRAMTVKLNKMNKFLESEGIQKEVNTIKEGNHFYKNNDYVCITDKLDKEIKCKHSDGSIIENEYWKDTNIEKYEKISDGREYWYDDLGREIKYKSKDGWTSGTEYYGNTDTIKHEKWNNGVENWYDEQSRLIKRKSNDGTIVETEYYGNTDKVKYRKYSDGSEYWYDEQSRQIKHKFIDGEIVEIKYYGNTDKVKHTKYSTGSEIWYDEQSRQIKHKFIDGTIVETEYYGNTDTVKHKKYSTGSEIWYDADSNVINKN